MDQDPRSLHLNPGKCLYCRYGEEAAQATNKGLDAAGHAFGTAWAACKIRKALDPKSVVKPTNLAKSAVKAAAAYEG
ncbi:Senescence/dehydration-associated protein-related [Quillaja saponaria]|uniref:Senescence/dehydration-associated protein-related n=1 Tax=Quillaja saponaria TaxID=32244 RepID=A0AAD7KQX3_QUISA|nr:Senescence/dehydration-associated protein-related [Quillaja saponaria]